MQNGGAGDRNVLPRWRSLARTPAHELRSSRRRAGTDRDASATALELALARWRRSRSLEDAADVVDRALIDGRYEPAAAAAAALLAPDSPAVDGLKAAAAQVAGRSEDRFGGLAPESGGADLRATARALKRRLLDAPRDAISAVELARLYALQGQHTKAEALLHRAVLVAPDNRFVLRSASHYFSIRTEPDRAMALLQKSEAVRNDPWVQAAEVAVADSLGRTPRWASAQVKPLLRSKAAGIQFSELAAGLATLELKAGGARKHVRKLAEVSLGNPTENALAQAMWLKDRNAIDALPSLTAIEDRAASEALMFAAEEREDYEAAVAHARAWALDQGTAIVPALATGYFCTVHLNRYDTAIDVGAAALRVHPGNPSLLNNQLVALALAGRLDEAERLLPLLETARGNPHMLPYVHAARGLLAYRRGRGDEGDASYAAAAEASKSLADPVERSRLVAGVLIYWLEQEAVTGRLDTETQRGLVAHLDKLFAKANAKARRDIRRVWASRKRVIEAASSPTRASVSTSFTGTLEASRRAYALLIT